MHIFYKKCVVVFKKFAAPSAQNYILYKKCVDVPRLREVVGRGFFPRVCQSFSKVEELFRVSLYRFGL